MGATHHRAPPLPGGEGEHQETEDTQAGGSRALGLTVRVPGAVRAHVPSAGRLCSVRAAARLKTTSLDFGFHQEEVTGTEFAVRRDK